MARRRGDSGPKRSAPSEAARQKSVGAYLRQRPNWATELMFVVPLLLLYQVGTFLTDQRNGVDWVTTLVFRLRARSEQGFLVFSVIVLGVVAGLYVHLRRRQRFQLRMLGPVLLESGAYALVMGNAIVLVMIQLLGLQPPSVALGSVALGSWGFGVPDPGAVATAAGGLGAGGLGSGGLGAGGLAGGGPALAVGGELSVSMVLFISAGAGLHEELVFRVLLFGGLLALLRRGLSVGPALSLLLALAVSAALFSYAHHLPPHGEPFTTFAFVFRLLAGVVFGLLYHLRGFATAVYTHFLYDVLVLGVWS
jgi:hypothetical protein